MGSSDARPVPSFEMSGPDHPFEPVLDPGAEQHAGGADADEAEEDPSTDRGAADVGRFTDVGALARSWVVDHHTQGTEPTRRWDHRATVRSCRRHAIRRWRRTTARAGRHEMSTERDRHSGIPGFGGELLRPGDDRYDEARAVFNGMIDRHPALIAVCSGADDVVAAVNFARDAGAADLGVRRRPRRHRRGGDRRRPVDRPARHEGRSRSTPTRAPCAPRPGSTGASSMPRRRSTGSRSPAGGCPTPASSGSRSGAAAAGSSASSASPATTCIGAEVVTADGRVVKASADRERRPVLGAARRRRQLRHRHRSSPAAAPGRPDRVRRHAGVAGADGRRRRSVLARLHDSTRPTRWAARSRSSPRRRPTSCPSRCAATRSSDASCATRATSRRASG